MLWGSELEGFCNVRLEVRGSVNALSPEVSPLFSPNQKWTPCSFTCVKNSMKNLFLATIFIGAFLLFQIQPLVGKITTPFFGGSASIWVTCMFFFQSFLLVGYIYAHIVSKFSIPKQVIIHFILLLCCFLFLPVSVELFHLGAIEVSPQISILATLLFSVGAPYFLLATSVPILQKWFSVIKPNADSDNYYFYAFSNAGALLGLLSYPFFVEPKFSIDSQKIIWTISFLLYAFMLLYIAFLALKSGKAARKVSEFKWTKKTLLTQLYWLALSLTGVTLLLSITNAITQNIPPVPFLWVLPLVIFLATYIISFSRRQLYYRWMTVALFIPSSICAVVLYFTSTVFDVYSQFIIYCITLAFGCMICHGELAGSRPSEEYLTKYYLIISLGGFLGGLIVSVISPAVFDEYLELPAGIVLTMSLLLLGSVNSSRDVSFFTILRAKQISLFFGIGIFAGLFFFLHTSYTKFDLFTSRNFYGTLSVKDIKIDGVNERRLVDGMTSHGAQSLDSKTKHVPLAYYSYESGIGLVLTELKKSKNLNMGVIGLGAGTLAAYGGRGDSIEFFELNPDVVRVANNYFTYLSDSPASIDITLGDGRLSLSKRYESSSLFNVLVVDAFSSDSIPKHLLTLEAFQLYWRHLSDDGVLALHISNRYLDLLPVVKAAAEKMGARLMYFSQDNSAVEGASANWVFITNNDSLLSNSTLRNNSNDVIVERSGEVLWVDNFSSLFHVLK